MTGVVIGDNCGSKIAAGMAVNSPLFCKVAPPRRMDWGIGSAVVRISLVVSDSSGHGVAISCSGLASGGPGNVIAKVGHFEASKTWLVSRIERGSVGGTVLVKG
jgi:hypothetical protein